MELSQNNLTFYRHIAVFHRMAGFFTAKGAKASRPLRNTCDLCVKKTPLCGEKPQHDGEKSSYFVTIPKCYEIN
jgi:hypothetical protein